MTAQLNPDAKAYLERMANSGRPLISQLPAPVARKQYQESSPLVTPDRPAVAAVKDISISGPHGPLLLRSYRPLGSKDHQALPVLIYIHGGGWTVGDIETHDVLCRQLANETPCAVISVDYRLAPEHKFPVAVDECIAATRWVAENAVNLGLDKNRIAIGGDSAGGNLAAVVALDARDHQGPALCFQLLIYPATDQNCTSKSHMNNGKGYFLTRELISYFRDNYLEAKDRDDWRASPLLAKDHSRLPPALVMVAGFDPLIDEGEAYANKMRAAGVHVTTIHYADMIHGFLRLGRAIPDAQLAVSKTARSLAEAFA